jgi:hypothetical protein
MCLKMQNKTKITITKRIAKFDTYIPRKGKSCSLENKFTLLQFDKIKIICTT